MLIPTNFIINSEEAIAELHRVGWSVGIAGFSGSYLVSGHKDDMRIAARAPTELAAWLLACDKVNEQERLFRERN